MQFETMNGLKRTHMCGTLSKDNNGEEVVLCGWVARNRKLGGLDFVTLRDRSGIIQLSFNDETDSAVFEKATALKSEYVIAIRGTVALRTEKNINPDMKTGEIEVFVSELRVLNGSETPPFYIEENIDTNDALRLKSKHRFLQRARPRVQETISFRAVFTPESSMPFHSHLSSINSFLCSAAMTDIFRLHVVSEMRICVLTDSLNSLSSIWSFPL